MWLCATTSQTSRDICGPSQLWHLLSGYQMGAMLRPRTVISLSAAKPRAFTSFHTTNGNFLLLLQIGGSGRSRTYTARGAEFTARRAHQCSADPYCMVVPQGFEPRNAVRLQIYSLVRPTHLRAGTILFCLKMSFYMFLVLIVLKPYHISTVSVNPFYRIFAFL